MRHSIRTLFFNLSLVLAGISVADGAEVPKFHAAVGPEPVIGRYLVTLDQAIAEDLAHASAESLARAYNGQLELYSSSDVRQFAIAMLPSRARTLSADPRVREVVEIAQSDPTATTEPPTPRVIANPGGSMVRHLTPAALDSSSTGTYVYDGAGNIESIGTDTFFYDVEGRVTKATVQGNQQSYTYDVFGNRMSATRATGAVGCVGGCEATVTVTHQTNHLGEQTYDEAGNVSTGFGAAYKYDGTGMVTEATVGSDIRDFVYTADDERLAVRRGTTWTWTVRDRANKVLREFTSLETSASPLTLTTHTWSKDYVWRDGLLLASVFATSPTSTATYHYHLDHLGTPRFLTRDGGVLVGKHTYYPFGAEMDLTPHEGTVELMKFTGHERDIVAADNATVDYMHARSYNGNLGRFLAVDSHRGTADVPQSWNRFAYARNNPLMRIDPDGLRDIYIAVWNARAPYLFGRGSVGHAGAFEMNGNVILSQFPLPHGVRGENKTLPYADTVAAEHRLPDAVFKVFVPNDVQFDAVAAEKKAMPTWYPLPVVGDATTNCVDAVGRALNAGGVPIQEPNMRPDWPVTPGHLGDRLQELQGSSSQPWSVQSVPVDVLGTPPTHPPVSFWTILEGILPALN